LCVAINSTLTIIGLFGETFAGEPLLDDVGDGRGVLVCISRWTNRSSQPSHETAVAGRGLHVKLGNPRLN
jgi:hypothetical protein